MRTLNKCLRMKDPANWTKGLPESEIERITREADELVQKFREVRKLLSDGKFREGGLAFEELLGICPVYLEVSVMNITHANMTELKGKQAEFEGETVWDLDLQQI